MTDRLEVFVAGNPVTQGSKKAFAYKSKLDGSLRATVVDDNKESLQNWRALVGWAAQQQLTGQGMVAAKGEAVKLSLTFHLKRPGSHFRTGQHAGELKPASLALWPVGKNADIDKLTRAILDALTGVAYEDDGQVVAFGELRKQYVMPALMEGLHKPGVDILAEKL